MLVLLRLLLLTSSGGFDSGLAVLGRVGQVVVRLGAGGPAERHCRISAEGLPFGRVVVEESDTDLFAAIDRATGRIGRLFGRELERVRNARVGASRSGSQHSSGAKALATNGEK
jgi:hypothetical protein